MRSSNPFSPGFGSPPEVFFGRAAYLELLSEAIRSGGTRPGSFFIEGLRGSGKTVLLHRMAEFARDRKWLAFEMHSRHAAEELQADLEGLSESRTSSATLSPRISLPPGAELSIGSRKSESSPRRENLLSRLMVERVGSLGRGQGLFIAVDEAQKLPAPDAEELCVAVQSALVQRLPVVLVLAGLPSTKDHVSAFRGCTFMKRSRRVVLELLGREETMEAVRSSFALVPEIGLGPGEMERLAAFSQGHPYLIQLVGDALYHVMDELYGASYGLGIERIEVGPGELGLAEDRAYDLYRSHVLEPVLRPLGDVTKRYLLALGDTMDERGLMTSNGRVSAALGKKASDLSPIRDRLVKRCLLGSEGRGLLRLRLPYTLRYLRDEAEGSDPEEFEGLADPWPVLE